EHAQREAGVDDLVRQGVGGTPAALNDRIEAHFLGVADSVRQLGENPAFVEVRGVHDVSGCAESIGEADAASRQTLRMMKEKDLSQGDPALCGVSRPTRFG